jgi:hypothetical protein
MLIVLCVCLLFVDTESHLKDQLNDPSNFPTKNDGMQSFFEIRNIVFEELSDLARNRLKSIQNASFSLDKVTV